MSDQMPKNDGPDSTVAAGAEGVEGAAAVAQGAAAEARDVQASAARDLDRQQARLAYSIIQTLLTHTTVAGDLIALMAQVLDRDTIEALTNTPHWAAYLDSRRALGRAREQLEQFTEIMNRLGEDG